MKNNPSAFQRRLQRGIPKEHRWGVWKSLMLRTNGIACGREAREREKFLFSGPNAVSCVAGLLRADSTWSQAIEDDAARTFAECQAFSKEHQASLCKVLNAYVFLNPQVGYCQGMTYIAGLLLLASDCSEHETLFFFVRLMEDCGWNGLYKEGFPLLHKYNHSFDVVLDLALPDLQRHFAFEGVETADYFQQWVLTLFTCCLPMQTVLLLWDTFMCNGLETVVLAALAILSSVKEILLAKDHEEIMQFFKQMRFNEDEEDAVEIGRCLSQKIDALGQEPDVQRHLGIGVAVPTVPEKVKAIVRMQSDAETEISLDVGLQKYGRRVSFENSI